MITSERLSCGCVVRSVKRPGVANCEVVSRCPTHETESLVRLANKYGYLLTCRKSATHRIMQNDQTGEELEIEYLYSGGGEMQDE